MNEPTKFGHLVKAVHKELAENYVMTSNGAAMKETEKSLGKKLNAACDTITHRNGEIVRLQRKIEAQAALLREMATLLTDVRKHQCGLDWSEHADAALASLAVLDRGEG